MDLAPALSDIRSMVIVNGGRGKQTLRCVAALVAMVLVPSLAPDTFGLACPHHAGHGGDHGGDETHEARQSMAQGGSVDMDAAPAMSGHGGHSVHVATSLDAGPHGGDARDTGSHHSGSPDAGSHDASSHDAESHDAESHDADSPGVVSHGPDSPDAGPPPCTCAGQCPVSGAPPAPGTGVRVVAEAPLESISTEVEPAPLLSAPTPFVLPFATAPPIA